MAGVTQWADVILTAPQVGEARINSHKQRGRSVRNRDDILAFGAGHADGAVERNPSQGPSS